MAKVVIGKGIQRQKVAVCHRKPFPRATLMVWSPWLVFLSKKIALRAIMAQGSKIMKFQSSVFFIFFYFLDKTSKFIHTLLILAFYIM